MSEETLQTDGLTFDESEVETPETLEGSESAPDMSEGSEENTGSGKGQQEAESSDPKRFTERMNKKHFELMEERREKEALAQQLAELKAKLPQEQRPYVPEAPDPYDPDYEQKIVQYKEALRQEAIYEAKQEQARQLETVRQQQIAQEQQKRVNDAVALYDARAKTLGVSQQELQMAGQLVHAYGVNQDLVMAILEDDKGPMITTYLAKNPEELELIRSMSPVKAAMHLATNVKPKLSGTKKSAPTPVETLGGGGSPPRERGPAGMTYE